MAYSPNQFKRWHTDPTNSSDGIQSQSVQVKAYSPHQFKWWHTVPTNGKNILSLRISPFDIKVLCSYSIHTNYQSLQPCVSMTFNFTVHISSSDGIQSPPIQVMAYSPNQFKKWHTVPTNSSDGIQSQSVQVMAYSLHYFKWWHALPISSSDGIQSQSVQEMAYSPHQFKWWHTVPISSSDGIQSSLLPVMACTPYQFKRWHTVPTSSHDGMQSQSVQMIAFINFGHWPPGNTWWQAQSPCWPRPHEQSAWAVRWWWGVEG